MNTLHICSDIPGQLFKASTEPDAVGKSEREAKAGHRALVERIMSMNDLIRLFNRLANGSDEWGTVNFHTHGSGGSIALGSNSLNLDSVARLENMDYGRIFAKDCVITFEGCNVAEGAAGEFFLVEIGDTLLSVKGGKVRGNTGAGLGTSVVRNRGIRWEAGSPRPWDPAARSSSISFCTCIPTRSTSDLPSWRIGFANQHLGSRQVRKWTWRSAWRTRRRGARIAGRHGSSRVSGSI